MAKKGLYYNINKKRERIAAGSGEKMRKPGSTGAPTAQNFKEAAKTAKLSTGGYVTTKGCGAITPNRKKKTIIT